MSQQPWHLPFALRTKATAHAKIGSTLAGSLPAAADAPPDQVHRHSAQRHLYGPLIPQTEDDAQVQRSAMFTRQVTYLLYDHAGRPASARSSKAQVRAAEVRVGVAHP